MWDEIVLTLDVDWAPEEVIGHSLDLLARAGVAATVFATHASPLLRSSGGAELEIGLHPNFNTLLTGQGRTAASILDELLQEYPEAKGERSHSRTVSAGILSLLMERGLLYDANQIIPFQPDLTAYAFQGFARFTDYWQDDVFLAGCGQDFSLADVPCLGTGLKIFNFHPIHVFLNTDCPETYAAAKLHYHDPAALRGMRNTRRYGIGDCFADVLALARERGSGRRTLAGLARELLSAC